MGARKRGLDGALNASWARDPKAFPVAHIEADMARNFNRDESDYGDLESLYRSISEHGQLAPVGISRTPNDRGLHELHWGFRRYLAVVKYGGSAATIWIEWDDRDEASVLQAQVRENNDRENPSHYSNALAVARAKHVCATRWPTNEAIAKNLGFSVHQVQRYLQHYSILQALRASCDEQEWRKLVGLTSLQVQSVAKFSAPDQKRLLLRFADEGTTLREAEKLAAAASAPAAEQPRRSRLSEKQAQGRLESLKRYVNETGPEKIRSLKQKLAAEEQKLAEKSAELKAMQSQKGRRPAAQSGGLASKASKKTKK